eukprot:scaffold24377_cov132-Cylindrotheca_fusiformis.AAC.4
MGKNTLSTYSSEESLNTFDTKTTVTSRSKVSMKSLTAARAKRRVALRSVLIFSLALATAICSSLAYYQLSSTEENVGLQTYQSIALSATEGARSITERKFQGSEVMSTLLSQTLPNATNWPFIEVDGYIEIAAKVAQLSSSGTQSLMVIVRPDEARRWENHTWNVYRSQGRPIDAGASEFGFGIWRPDFDEVKQYEDGRVHDATGETNWGGKNEIFAVLMMHNKPSASSQMYNVYSQENRGIHIDSMFDCIAAHGDPTTKPSCPVVTDMLELVVRTCVKPGPAGLLFQPIFPQSSPNEFVGFATTSIHWSDVLTNVVPDYVNGLTCVISTATSAYTFEIQQGLPELKGYGDLHDDRYTSYARSVILNEIETGSSTSAVYTLTVYPTEEMFSAFSTSSPTTVAIGFAGVIAVVACIFFGYDYLMRREAEERKTILEMKRKFVRFISHEIRTPLNTVCMGLELLQSELKAPKGLDVDVAPAAGETLGGQVTDEDVGFWLNVTQDTNENAHIAVEILNDLLNYDKLETGTLELETEPVLIWDLITKTVNQFGIQAANRKLELKLNIERPSGLTIPDVEEGESHDPYNVIGDSIRLSQVIRNLISNALKFAPENSTIRVSATYLPNGLPNAKPMLLGDEATPSHERAGSLQLCVKDKGVGMSKEQLERLFSEGVQFDANRLQHGGGSGLGLNIAKGLVEQHSGTIKADSPGLGLGTTFTVELPLYEFQEEELKKAIDDRDSTTAPSSSNATRIDFSGEVESNKPMTRRVLVAEDSASSRKMLIRLLERAGHTCVPASNGREAVDIMKEDLLAIQANANHVPIDTVLMDFEMPLLRGPDATKRIRTLNYKGIILGITGNVQSEDVEYFMKHGADEVFPKPVSLKEIQRFWRGYEKFTSTRIEIE